MSQQQGLMSKGQPDAWGEVSFQCEKWLSVSVDLEESVIKGKNAKGQVGQQKLKDIRVGYKKKSLDQSEWIESNLLDSLAPRQDYRKGVKQSNNNLSFVYKQLETNNRVDSSWFWQSQKPQINQINKNYKKNPTNQQLQRGEIQKLKSAQNQLQNFERNRKEQQSDFPQSFQQGKYWQDRKFGREDYRSNNQGGEFRQFKRNKNSDKLQNNFYKKQSNQQPAYQRPLNNEQPLIPMKRGNRQSNPTQRWKCNSHYNKNNNQYSNIKQKYTWQPYHRDQNTKTQNNSCFSQPINQLPNITPINSSKEKERFIPQGRRCWPQSSIYILGCKLCIAYRPIKEFRCRLLVIPYSTLKMQYYPGNIINSSSVDYKARILSKGGAVSGPGQVYLQKAVSVGSFAGLAFLKVDEKRISDSLKIGIKKLINQLQSIDQVLDSLIFPICDLLSNFQTIICSFIDNLQASHKIKEVYITTNQPQCFMKSVNIFIEKVQQMLDDNEILIS